MISDDAGMAAEPETELPEPEVVWDLDADAANGRPRMRLSVLLVPIPKQPPMVELRALVWPSDLTDGKKIGMRWTPGGGAPMGTAPAHVLLGLWAAALLADWRFQVLRRFGVRPPSVWFTDTTAEQAGRGLARAFAKRDGRV